MSVPNASSRQQSLLLDLISYTQPPVPPAVRVDAFQVRNSDRFDVILLQTRGGCLLLRTLSRFFLKTSFDFECIFYTLTLAGDSVSPG